MNDPREMSFSTNPVSRLPGKLVSKIVNLVFVEMVDLLQESWHEMGDSDSATKMFWVVYQRKAPISDIVVWCECFCLMATVLAAKYPSKPPDLMLYLRRIMHCARMQYSVSVGDQSYDRLYRRHAISGGLHGQIQSHYQMQTLPERVPPD